MMSTSNNGNKEHANWHSLGNMLFEGSWEYNREGVMPMVDRNIQLGRGGVKKAVQI